MKDIELLKRNGLYDAYKKIEDKISINPYNPDLPPGNFSKMKGMNNIYHARINIKHRVFYTIMKTNDEISVIISDIDDKEENEIVKIIKAFGHDLK